MQSCRFLQVRQLKFGGHMGMRVPDWEVGAQRPTGLGGCGWFSNQAAGRTPGTSLVSRDAVPVAAFAAGWRGRWTGQGVSLYRAAQTTISVVATIWIAPSTMNTPAPMATARAVIRRDDSSHTA